MSQIGIISGIYGTSPSNFMRSVPVNVTPIAEPGDGGGTGVSKGYLEIVAGVRTIHTLTGKDRGSALYGDKHLRVVGDTLYNITDTLTIAIGTLGNDNKPVQFAEGFGRIAIASAKKLYYYDGTTLSQVTDPDLGDALSVAWSDSYFLTTDGSYIVATDLADPTKVDPLRYGSSEADPDPVVGMLALRGEVYALNKYTIEKFINGGTTGFPFQRSRGGQIPKGIVGRDAYTPFVETFAFCGSARNESAAVYLGGSGQAIRISPRSLDDVLANLSPDELAAVELETINRSGLYQLLVHTPRETWVYHWSASQLLDLPVWSKLAGGTLNEQTWPARHYQQVGTSWWCGSDGKLGKVDEASDTLFGDAIGYRFDTPFVYNGGNGAIAHAAELTTRGTANVAMSYTNDGRTWSQERWCSARRLIWRRLGRMANFRGFRFRGIKNGQASFARLEVQLEPTGG